MSSRSSQTTNPLSLSPPSISVSSRVAARGIYGAAVWPEYRLRLTGQSPASAPRGLRWRNRPGEIFMGFVRSRLRPLPPCVHLGAPPQTRRAIKLAAKQVPRPFSRPRGLRDCPRLRPVDSPAFPPVRPPAEPPEPRSAADLPSSRVDLSSSKILQPRPGSVVRAGGFDRLSAGRRSGLTG